MDFVDFGAVARVVEHRPYAPPERAWVMTMSWHDLLFAHWRVDVDALRALVPPVLPLDLYDGAAYVAVVPFRMSHVSARGVPAIPGVSAFCELNVRTYVTLDGRPGVYFFSLDAENPLAVWGARTFFHLPYFDADMALAHEEQHVLYRSERVDARAPPGVLRARYHPRGEVFVAEPGSLERFLTERYCLYAVDEKGSVYRGEIHHRPWPLQQAHARFDECTVQPPGLALEGAPLLHFAKRLDVVGWPIERVRD